MTEWSNDLCITFMELYQMESLIWDPKHPYHKDKNKVNDAWDRISKEINIPIQDLKNKKISLMATFRGHLRKKKASIKSGAGLNEIYKPVWFLYDLMESFLGNINECLPTIDTDKQGNNSQAVEIEEEHEEPRINEEVMTPESPILERQHTLPPEHLRRRGSEYIIKEASKQMKDTFNTLNNVLKDKRTEEDECELYGKLLAKKLRGLPENERTIFMYEIDGMFINRLHNMSRTSPNYIPQRPSSSQSSYIPQRPTSSQSPFTLQRPTSSQSSYSEPLRISKRPNSACSSHSEPAIPNKMIHKYNMTPQTYPPVLQYNPTSRMPSPKPTIIVPNPTTSPQSPYTPQIHIPHPDDNSQPIIILSDQIVSPVRDYFENFDGE